MYSYYYAQLIYIRKRYQTINDINLSLSSIALKNELTNKITMTHTIELSYSDIWNASKSTDLNPFNNSELLLIYGYENGSDSDPNNNRERS